MFCIRYFLQTAMLSSIWALFLSSTAFAAPNTSTPSVTSNNAAIEKQKAVEEVNSLIIGSYKSRLDRVLDDLYSNIEEASKGSVTFQITALQKVRDDLDEGLDSLSEESISPNRRKILTGVYFYLKSNIEGRIRMISPTGTKKMPLK
jgi:hypothetical protein